MKMNTTRSPKFLRLMALSGLGRAASAGTLELLWLFVMDQSPAGDVGKWSDDEIEAELDWKGEPGALINALVDSRWLDRCQKNRLVVHDWADHLPEFIKKRVKRDNLTIASIVQPCLADGTPCPDNGSQRLPTAHKRREEKGSQEKRSMKDPSDLALSEIPEVTEGTEPWRPLLNAISKLDGEVDEKSAWLAENYDSIAIAVEEGKRGFKGETMAWQASEPIYEATEAAIPEGAMLELSSTEDPF